MRVFFLALLFLWTPDWGFSYVDPGTGSALLSIIIALLTALVFFVRGLYYKVVQGVAAMFGVKTRQIHYPLVFYSEGKTYWFTFQPILEALDAMNVSALFLTSDEDDRAFTQTFQSIECRYIGKGYAAYAQLNKLRADLCVMTTPGLDVLDIKRSKNVQHYVYVFHACTDIHLYELFSFDYYDSVMCSGPHQMESIRRLEDIRGTRPKTLCQSGCPYMDVVSRRYRNAASSRHKDKKNPSILISPTWRNNNLLRKHGISLIKILAKQDYSLIIRPHPQSLISEKEFLDELRAESRQHTNIVWDDTPDNFDTLNTADIMIADFSGIIFDYALIFQKPIITLDMELNFDGLEANDLKTQAWELSIIPQITHRISPSEIPNLPQKIAEILSKSASHSEITRRIRQESIFHYGESGERIAQQLYDIQHQKNI